MLKRSHSPETCPVILIKAEPQEISHVSEIVIGSIGVGVVGYTARNFPVRAIPEFITHASGGRSDSRDPSDWGFQFVFTGIHD